MKTSDRIRVPAGLISSSILPGSIWRRTSISSFSKYRRMTTMPTSSIVLSSFYLNGLIAAWRHRKGTRKHMRPMMMLS